MAMQDSLNPLFERALIVEDLDEPRQWLMELLPQALPAVRTVDAVATLAQARERMREHAYGLALVDWHQRSPHWRAGGRARRCRGDCGHHS